MREVVDPCRAPRTLCAALTAILLIGFAVFSESWAQSYSQLQVLLPGESAAPGTGTGKLGTPAAQTVGIPFDVRIRACDVSWNTVASVTNLVALESSDDSAALPGSVTLVSGEVTVAATLNTDGSFTLTAEDRSDLTIPLASSAFVTVYALHRFEFSRINQKNQFAGQPMSITVTAVDATGSVVTGYSGSVRLQEITSFGEGRITPGIITLSNGTWTGGVTNYRADETSINRGNVNILASLEANPSIHGISDPFTVHPGPFSRVQIVVPGESAAPGSASGVSGSTASQGAGQTFAVEVFATDAYWNPLPSSDVVRITSSDAGASTPVSGGLSEGYRQFTVSLGTVGTQTLTVTDQTSGSISGMTSRGIPVTPSAPDHFVFEPIPSPRVAGEPVSVTIRATDVGGNTIPDFSGNAVLTSNTGPGSISPEAIVFTGGIWTGAMVFRGAGGAVAVTCSDFSSPPHFGTSGSFEVLPGPFTALQVLLAGQIGQGGTASGFSGEPAEQGAGSSFDVRIRAVDDYFNRIPGIDDRISISSSDPFAAFVADTSLTNGELSLPVTLFRAGSQNLSAVDTDAGGIASATSSDVTILAGPYSRILLLAPGEELAPGAEEGRSGSATDQSINFAFTVQVLATDAWWNPVGGVSEVVRVTSDDLLAELPPDTPMAQGEAHLSLRLSTGGFHQITAANITQPGMTPSVTQLRAISSGFHLEAEVNPTNVRAGEPFTLTVQVTNDAGSVIQEINSSVQVEVQNASSQEPGRGELSTTQFQLLQGQRSVQETYTFAETIILVVRDDAGNVPAVTEAILVVPGPPAAVELSSDPAWVGGNKHAEVSASVVDAYGNGVDSQPVDFELLAGNGILTPIDFSTGETGIARADFLSPRRPDVSRIRAASGEFASELDIETALVNPGQSAGTVTNYPNPFHPGEAPTTIAYKLASDARVSLRVYSLIGSEVLQEVFETGASGGREGLNEFLWDGRNGRGSFVASGGYHVVIEAEGNGETLHVMRRRVAVVR